MTRVLPLVHIEAYIPDLVKSGCVIIRNLETIKVMDGETIVLQALQKNENLWIVVFTDSEKIKWIYDRDLYQDPDQDFEPKIPDPEPDKICKSQDL